MRKEEIKKRLHDIGIIYNKPVKLSSGKISDYYCDIKKAYGEPDLLNYFSEEIGKLLSPETTCIAASGYGGLPLAACVASRFSKKFVAVRDKEKDHGKGGLIDGYIPKNKDVVTIVDDVLTTGSSINSVLMVLKKNNTKVNQIVVIVKRGNPELSIPYKFLFSISDLIKGA